MCAQNHHGVNMEKFVMSKLGPTVVLVILFAMTRFVVGHETCVVSRGLGVCNGGNYTFLPRERALYIKTLSIIDSRLDSQTLNDLSSFSSLNELRVLNSSLKITSEIKVSKTLPQLKVVHFSRCNLTEELVSAILTLAPNVKRLSLQWNKLARVPETLFSALQHVESIDISHNAISEIEPGAFHDLPALTRVDASYNQIGRRFDSRVLAIPSGCAVCTISKYSCSQNSIRGCKNNGPVDALHQMWNQKVFLLVMGNPVCSQVESIPLNFKNTSVVGTEGVRVGECLFYEFGSCPLHEHRRRFLYAACGRELYREILRTLGDLTKEIDEAGVGGTYPAGGVYVTKRVWRINWPVVGAVVFVKVLLGCCCAGLRMKKKRDEEQRQHPRGDRFHNLKYGPEPIPMPAP